MKLLKNCVEGKFSYLFIDSKKYFNFFIFNKENMELLECFKIPKNYFHSIDVDKLNVGHIYELCDDVRYGEIPGKFLDEGVWFDRSKW